MAGLGQIRLLAEVADLEQGAGALGGAGGDDGRVDIEEAVVVQKVDDGPLDRRPHAHDRPLPAAAQPQVAVVHQELDAVLLGRDRVADGVLQHFGRVDVDLIPLGHAGGAGIGLHRAADDERRLLPQVGQPLEQLVAHVRPVDNALGQARAVAQAQEQQLALGRQVIEPAANGDALADMVGDAFDGDWVGHGCLPQIALKTEVYRKQRADSRRCVDYPGQSQPERGAQS